MGKIYATNNPEVSEREQRNMERSRRIASQGMVLLQNDGTLPLVNKGKIALYGNGARCTVKGGTGSGDVNSRFVVNVEQGLTEAGFEITTRSWMDRYDRVIEAKRAAYIEEFKAVAEKEKTQAFWFLFYNPFKEPVMVPIEQEDITADETDTAVFVISRNSGEGKDRRVIAGEYELFEEEKAAIQTLVESYEKVIVVLNVGGVIDTRYLRSVEGINAILLMSQAGNIGGYALADILSGKQTPSGHLTDTRAENYGDYPGAADFYRMHTNAHIDERTIREIYLKGFEIAVKEAHPMSIMTSYNLINGIHTANSAELLTSIVRNEWGFEGIIMSDWGATGSDDPKRDERKLKYGFSSAAGCIKAGNDLIMPGGQRDVDDLLRAVGAMEGETDCPLTVADLQACTRRIIHLIMQSLAYEDAEPYGTHDDIK